MNKYLLCILSFVFCLSNNLKAQPQWKFYIAFEDGIGQKDTLWCIWDTLASSTGVDTIFGEQAIQLDNNQFNVYIFNPNSDTTKVSALDSFGAHQLLIEAMNYQHPIHITWDSTILHQNLSFLITGYANYARIQNDYFFFINNCPSCQQYDMWIDNYAFGPWYSFASQYQFPMEIYILSDPTIGLEESIITSNLSLFPNPANDYIQVSGEGIESLKIYDISGRLVKSISTPVPKSITIRNLPNGLYPIAVETRQGTFYKKVVISH